MDGASRFTQRDAVASILITGINIIAGFLIGVFQHGMEFCQGARKPIPSSPSATAWSP